MKEQLMILSPRGNRLLLQQNNDEISVVTEHVEYKEEAYEFCHSLLQWYEEQGMSGTISEYESGYAIQLMELFRPYDEPIVYDSSDDFEGYGYDEVEDPEEFFYDEPVYGSFREEKEEVKVEPKKKVSRKTDSDSGMLIGPFFQGAVTHTTEGPFSSVKEEVIMEGELVDLDYRPFKDKKTGELNGRGLLTGNLVDEVNSIAIKKFVYKSDQGDDLFKALKGSHHVLVKGFVEFDEEFKKDYVLDIQSIKPATKESSKRMDEREDTRVELHLHTKMSDKDGLITIKDLINRIQSWGHEAVAITDHGVVQSFPEAQAYGKEKGVKVIYGVEAYMMEEENSSHRNHIVLLAKNQVGLRNLYKLVSISHLNYFDERPRLPRSIIENHREGLLIGSACEKGELIEAILKGTSMDTLQEMARFYDYLEVQPVSNYRYLMQAGLAPNEEALLSIHHTMVALGKALHIPVVATSDAHYLDPEDHIFREIMRTANAMECDQEELYFRTTEEMLQAFAHLGEEKAYEIVVTNSRAINDQVDKITPIPDGTYSPKIEGADEKLRTMCYEKARAIYGNPLPEPVEERLEYELSRIIGHGFGVLYYIAHKLVKKSLDDGYLVGSRGSVGSSFAATMADITEVNPLPPHYVCPQCKHSEFFLNGEYAGGFDLPRKNCPHCDHPLQTNGHDIPFAIFMGFEGDKVPDIDLNFSGDYQAKAHKYTEELFGRDNVFRAGTISTIADKTALGYAFKYAEMKGLQKKRAFLLKLSEGFTKVKNTTGQHPGGIMVCPRDMDVHHFTPIQYPSNKKESGIITTHFDYHSIEGRMTKLDILGHDDPTIIRMLEDMTGIDSRTIPFDDPDTLSLFSSTRAIGLTPKQLWGDQVATLAVPECGTGFVRRMLEDSKPKTFSDLVRISGFSHGTNVWLDNAQTLIKSGTCKLNEAISTRDDIMNYLMHRGIESIVSFSIMENVRKGKGIEKRNKEGVATTEYEKTMRDGNIPEWFIDSCKKISYLFPKAHAVAYVMMAFRIAWYKVNHPLAFYASYFSIRAKTFSLELMRSPLKVQQEEYKRLVEKKNKREANPKEVDMISALEVSMEMLQRGFTFANVDLYRSKARRFDFHDEKSLLPPFLAVDSLGEKVADAIVEEREEKPFLSVMDLRRRTKMSKTIAERMVRLQCLGDLPADDQVSLF